MNKGDVKISEGKNEISLQVFLWVVQAKNIYRGDKIKGDWSVFERNYFCFCS